jgi:hypothetical protein
MLPRAVIASVLRRPSRMLAGVLVAGAGYLATSAIGPTPAVSPNCDTEVHCDKSGFPPNVITTWYIECRETCGGNPPCGQIQCTDVNGAPALCCAHCPQNQDPPRCCHAVMILGPLYDPSWAGNCGSGCGDGSCGLSEDFESDPFGGSAASTWTASCQ